MPRVRWTNGFHAAGVSRRLTNRKRFWNTSAISCCMRFVLRAARRAVLSFADGRSRFTLGVDSASRWRSEATALKTPLTSSALTWKVHSWWGTVPQTFPIGSGDSAEPSVVIPLSELVASFANRQHLLKYKEKRHVCAVTTPMARVGKICSDHAHSVPRPAAACH